MTDSAEVDISRTTEQDPQSTSVSQIEDGSQSPMNLSISRTMEQDPQSTSVSQIEGSDATGLNKVGVNISIVDYTDSDESQTPSRNPVHVNRCFQISSPSSASDYELSLSKKGYHQVPIPRLRRTKSIQMKNWIDLDSDELFDSTSADSGEEYIPKTSEDSDGTDISEVLGPVKQRESQRDSLLQRHVDDIEDSVFSPTEASASSKQLVYRGRSPLRKRCSRGTRRKRQRLTSVSCATTPTRSGNSSKLSEIGDTGSLLENSIPDLDQNLPDSASSLLTEDRDSDDSLVIPTICKKENRSRIYNKKQFCLYCKLGVVKIARHLERAHPNTTEVAEALSFPKRSKERQMHLEHLRNRGNFAHNVEVLNSGVGNLVPRRQPRQDSKAQDFMHCTYCQGFYARKLLWRHMIICKFKPNVPGKPGKTRVQALCAFTTPPPPGVKQELWRLITNMVQDEVSSAVKSDACIMEYGEHLFNRLGYDAGKHEYIRQKCRELGRLLLCSRKTTSLKTIQDHIKPANFMQVVQAVKCVAGYDSEKHAYKCSSLALKIGHSLTKISLLVESRANVQNNYNVAKDARTFRRVYEARWNEMISAASLRTLQESKWNTPLLLPFTKDVQTLHSFLDVQQKHIHAKLSTEASSQTWTQLAKITLTQVILFNRRRAGEVSKIPLSAYLANNVSDPREDVSEALSALEKKLCQHFRRIETRGKRGRKVPVLLTPAMQQALDLLVSKRHECGVPQENKYLFARPTAFTCYRGSDSLRHFAKVCGATSPESLTSTKLHKQTGTLSQVLNLSNTELDQLADFLGHDIRVHRQFYRLPEGTLQLAKISKVLMALEKGRLAEFKGKTLDEISIDPEENVHPDSDAEVEPDKHESRVTSSQREENEASDVGHSNASPQQNRSDASPQQNRSDASPQQNRSDASPQQNRSDASPQHPQSSKRERGKC
ncbi:uncharacterized protein [Labrus bergylta]|uniref:uncharacterized protein n=1 Tax=Labrus bergylta TaxID=56723 RepID=UPI003313D3DC